MAPKRHNRQYDLVVFGATGYTGKLTCEHITRNLPTDLNWAVAGRSQSKLQDVIDECKQLNPDRAQPAIELADVSREETLVALSKKAYIVIAIVGPYCMYGEGMMKACVENGTNYIDCAGEFPWTVKMIKKYEATAKATGALVFPQTAVESAPPDLCTWVMAKHIRKTMGKKLGEVTMSLHELKGAPSGGTLASVLAIGNHFSLSELRDAIRPYAASPIPHDKPSKPSRPLLSSLFGAHTNTDLGLVTTSASEMIDSFEVERSWGLLATIPSRQKEFYGENFTWREYFHVASWLEGLAVHWGIILGGALLMFVPPVKWLLKKFIYQPGEGPSKAETAKERLEFRGVAKPDTDKDDETRRAFCRATFGGALYSTTAMFLSQAAMTILEDDTGLEGGFYTPACLGQPLIDRADAVGFKITVETREG